MKSILFALLLALSFTTALAEKDTNKGIDKSPALVSLFKKPESNILSNKLGGNSCVRQCMNEFYRCMRNGPGGTSYNYYVCEMQMEQCSTDCVSP